jgi:hypothetical protein
LSIPPEAKGRLSGGGGTSAAKAAKAWSDVVIRLLIVLGIALVLIEPGLFPFLKQFTVKSGEVNIFGSKFEISEIGSLIPGLEIRDGRLLLQGKDISALPDTIDQTNTANAELRQVNNDLSGQVKTISGLLEQVTKQRDDANRTLLSLRQSTPGIKSVETGELDTKIQQQLAQIQQRTTDDANAATSDKAASAAAVPPDLIYGVVFSADANKEQAMDEVRKAQGIKGVLSATIWLFQRQKFVRSVAAFPTHDAAASALPTFRAVWHGAYIVDFRTWCPVALNGPLNPGTTPGEIDCRF